MDRSSDFPVPMAIERHVIAAGEPVGFEFRRQRGAGHQRKDRFCGKSNVKGRAGKVKVARW